MAARAAESQRTMRRALPRVGRAGNRSRPRGSWDCSGCVFDAETRRRGDKDAEGDGRKSTPEKAEEAERCGLGVGKPRRLTDDTNRSSVPLERTRDGQAGRPVLQNVGIGDLQAAKDVDGGDDGRSEERRVGKEGRSRWSP